MGSWEKFQTSGKKSKTVSVLRKFNELATLTQFYWNLKVTAEAALTSFEKQARIQSPTYFRLPPRSRTYLFSCFWYFNAIRHFIHTWYNGKCKRKVIHKHGLNAKVNIHISMDIPNDASLMIKIARYLKEISYLPTPSSS